jgi:hypothetical protein
LGKTFVVTVTAAGKLDLHQVNVPTMLQERLPPIKVFVATLAKLASGIGDVTLGRRWRGLGRAIGRGSLDRGFLLLLEQKVSPKSSFALHAILAAQLVGDGQTVNDNLVVWKSPELLLVFLRADVVHVLKVERHVLQIVFDLGMTDSTEEILKINKTKFSTD